MKIGDKVNLNGKQFEVCGTHKRSLLLKDEQGRVYKSSEERLNQMVAGIPPARRKPAQRAVFEGKIPTSNIEIIDRISAIECELSPENLNCDGEASKAYVKQKYSRLTAERRALVQALGREPTYEEMRQATDRVWEKRRSMWNS